MIVYAPGAKGPVSLGTTVSLPSTASAAVAVPSLMGVRAPVASRVKSAGAVTTEGILSRGPRGGTVTAVPMGRPDTLAECRNVDEIAEVRPARQAVGRGGRRNRDHVRAVGIAWIATLVTRCNDDHTALVAHILRGAGNRKTGTHVVADIRNLRVLIRRSDQAGGNVTGEGATVWSNRDTNGQDKRCGRKRVNPDIIVGRSTYDPRHRGTVAVDIRVVTGTALDGISAGQQLAGQVLVVRIDPRVHNSDRYPSAERRVPGVWQVQGLKVPGIRVVGIARDVSRFHQPVALREGNRGIVLEFLDDDLALCPAGR
jgi:hypothetical protein